MASADKARWVEQVLATLIDAKDGSGRAMFLGPSQQREVLEAAVAATMALEAESVAGFPHIRAFSAV